MTAKERLEELLTIGEMYTPKDVEETIAAIQADLLAIVKDLEGDELWIDSIELHQAIREYTGNHQEESK